MAKYSVIFGIRINVEASHPDQVERMARRALARYANQHCVELSQKVTLIKVVEQKIYGLTADEFIRDEAQQFLDDTQSMDDFNKDIVEGNL